MHGRAVTIPEVSADENASGAYSRYLSYALATFGVAVLLVAAFNVAVDPYGVFGTPLIDDFNTVKVRAGQHAELFKAVGVGARRPDTIILGNSRAEVGFDPGSSAWPRSSAVVYNLGIPGTGLRTAADMLSYASASRTPAVVVFGLDFPDFLNDPAITTVPATVEVVPRTRRIAISEFAASTLSLGATANSFQTLIKQADPNAARITSLGFNPLFEYEALSAREGFHSLFAQKDSEYATRFAGRSFVLYPENDGISPDAAQLKAILDFCREHRISVKLVIYPYHARLMEIIYASGLGDEYEEWKRLLVRTVHDSATSEFRPTLWDFSGYSAYTTEQVPPASDRRTEVRWFWESGHFRPTLGTLILEDVFSEKMSVGTVLTPQNIDEHLARLRAERDGYGQQQPAVVTEIHALVDRLSAR
jgi:hypothetical protein